MNLVIIAVGLFGVITADNLIKKVMCLTIVENMVILSFLGVGFRKGATAPILTDSSLGPFVDPLPQALMLTAIVIGVCFNALAIACIVRLYQKTGSVLVSELHEL